MTTVKVELNLDSKRLTQTQSSSATKKDPEITLTLRKKSIKANAKHGATTSRQRKVDPAVVRWSSRERSRPREPLPGREGLKRSTKG